MGLRSEASAGPFPSTSDKYRFDQTISREVLENYLSCAISMEGLLNGRGDLDDNIRTQMPDSRTLVSPLDRKRWYYANNPSPAVPDGLGDEEAIRAIWAANEAKN